MRKCRKCTLEKEESFFVNDSYKKDGKTNLCKECKKLIDKISYDKRKEKISLQKKLKNDLHIKEVNLIKTTTGCAKCDDKRAYVFRLSSFTRQIF